MKSYPLIRRLSTLGIIHHQAFDYEFNVFRTDFVGDGGAGKSLISDLLQLIFVGTSAFHSPTKSTGGRKPRTMVLKSKGRGNDSGYAFLNIEVSENLYIIIGVYLESGGASSSFIIQNGTKFGEDDQLQPFNRLLGYQDFLKDDNILPIDYLKDYIQDTLNFTCESWQKVNKYHAILCSKSNRIIPVDISKNSKSLKNYAKIIQAFSRESLDISKSEKIQNFLFGDEKEYEFLKKFRKAVEDLNGDVKQYQLNSDEIKKLEEKQHKIQELLQLKNTRINAEREFRTHEYIFQINLIEEINKFINERLSTYYKSKASLIFLKTNAEKKSEQVEKGLSEITNQLSAITKEKNELEKAITIVKKIESYCNFFQSTNVKLLEIYKNFHASKKKIDRIKYLKEQLKTEDVIDFFENKQWGKNILVDINKKLFVLNEKLVEKKKLKALNNLDGKNSLAYWALNLERVLTLNEESIIHKYQNEGLEVSNPFDKGKKYIPYPDVLLQNLKNINVEKDGFWIDLSGIKDFIPLIDKPIFDTLDTEKIRTYFLNQTNQLDEDIKICEFEIDNYNSIYNIFNEFENAREYIDAWKSRNEISHLNGHEMFEISEGGLMEFIKLYSEADELDSKFKTVNENHKELDKRRLSLNTLKENLDRDLNSFPNLHKDIAIETYKDKYNFELPENNFNDVIDCLNKSENYYDAFSPILKRSANGLSQHDKIRQEDNERSELMKAIEDLKKKFSNYIGEIESKLEEQPSCNRDQLQQLESSHKEALKEYERAYDRIVNEYTPGKVKWFEEHHDFMDLCEEILPKSIFSDGEILDEAVVTKISKLLTDINIKNKGLNERKLKRLSDIIDEVNAEVSGQINYCRQIKNFLNSKDKIITGQHKATLRDNPNDGFPRNWMEKFINDLDKDIELGMGSDLFKPLKGITNHLEKHSSLEDKMREAFHHCGGSRSFKPSIEQLLNPKSYYELKFTIQSANGSKNDGSNSQTYAAIALFCIARLSLINENKIVTEGVRFMPIDEAAGLGANFDMLYDIAKDNNYQLLSLSIKPNKVDIENQNIYLLHNNSETEDRVNYDPVPIFGNQNLSND